jgi:hypothetical protein
MSFARRHPRFSYRCPVMLTLPGGETVLGETTDLSVGGAGVMLKIAATKLPKGTRVVALVEANDLPDPSGEGTVISVRATVASVALMTRGTATGYTRFGLEFQQEPAGLATRLASKTSSWPLAEGTGASTVVQSAPGPQLAGTPHGREILFQHARACLAGGNLAGAIEAMGWALDHAATNVAYRVLLLRAKAEAELAAGDFDAARAQANAALAIAPGTPEVTALVARVSGLAASAPARRSGFLGKLFRRAG